MPNFPYELIAIDVDDTLLNDNKDITKKTKQTILNLKNKDLLVTLASGRPYHSLKNYAKELEINLPLITANGGLIKDENRTYKKITFPKKLLIEIFNKTKKEEYIISIYYEDTIYTTSEKMQDIHRELKEVKNIKYIKSIDGLNLKDPIKILLHHKSTKKIKKGFNDFLINYGEKLHITRASEDSIEISNLKANKGDGIKFLASHLKIPINKTMVIGNGLNDVPMFKEAGFSVAMANSSEEVKAEADAITTSNNEEGVHKALNQKLLLNV